MRFLYKRPNMDEVRSELGMVLDVWMSEIFIFMDLFFFSLIFTAFLYPVLHSLILSLVFFSGSYVFFYSLYRVLFKKPKKKLY